MLLASPRGCCDGVARAIERIEREIDQQDGSVYVRKQSAHNARVVGELEGKGVIFVDEVDQVPAGARVVLGAHGVSPSVTAKVAARNLVAIDTTCPLVAKAHREAARFAQSGFEILLIGYEGHQEVEGTVGYAPGQVTVVQGPNDVPNIQVKNPERLVWLSQTTLTVDETVATVRRLRERFPKLQDPPSGMVCYASQNRQIALKKVAQDADVVIVLGLVNKSNSARFQNVALTFGAKRAYQVQSADEIQPIWLEGAVTVGVTSGVSVPELLVQDVLRYLADAGFAEVEEVHTVQDDLIFTTPLQLRHNHEGKHTSHLPPLVAFTPSPLGERAPSEKLANSEEADRTESLNDAPLPQFGEFATREEQIAHIASPSPVQLHPELFEAGTDAGDREHHSENPVSLHNPELDPVVVAKSRNRLNLSVTILLLLYGLFDGVMKVPGFFLLDVLINNYLDLIRTSLGGTIGSYVPGDATAPAGLGLSVLWLVLWVGAALWSWVRLRRERAAFWVPVVAGLVANLALATVMIVLVLQDPVLTQQLGAFLQHIQSDVVG